MNKSNKTYDELCDMNIGDMNKEELYDFANGLLNEVWYLEEIIIRADRYINNLYDDEYISYGNKEEFLKILRGENNE